MFLPCLFLLYVIVGCPDDVEFHGTGAHRTKPEQAPSSYG